MRLRLTIFAALLPWAVGAGCKSSSTHEPAAPVETSRDAAPAARSMPSYATAIERAIPRGTVPGAVAVRDLGSEPTLDALSEASDYVRGMDSYAFIVWQGGELRHEEYFAPHDEDLRPESASMHKSVLALVVGAAIQSGEISSVDDAVEVYVPEWRDTPRGQITIRNLLQMNSGLKKLSWEGGMESDAARFNLQGETARSTLLSLPLQQEPGTVFYYANTQSQLLALIVERATGKPYEDVLSSRIWQPIGAGTAYVWYNEPTGFPRTYSSLLATAEDWVKIGLLIKDGGRGNGQQVLAEDYIEDMITPSPTNPNYGFQVWLGNEYQPRRYYNALQLGESVPAQAPFLAGDLVFFDGFGGQRVYISRSLDLVIFRSGEMRADWDDSVLPNLVIEALELVEQ